MERRTLNSVVISTQDFKGFKLNHKKLKKENLHKTCQNQALRIEVKSSHSKAFSNKDINL